MAFDNNILNVRLCLKYDSLENWASKNPELKAGEVAIAYLPPKGTGEAPEATASGVLMKVGPGNFNALPWSSALAADVYGWAKENELKFSKAGTGNVVSGIEWDASLNNGKGGIKFTTASVATSEGFEQLQADVDAVEKDIDDNRALWEKDTTYTFVQTTDGKGITVTPSEGEGKTISFAFLTQKEIEDLNYLVKADITTGSANGTIAVEGTDVAVKGLQSAAYVTVDSLNVTAKGYADAVDAKIPTELGVMSIGAGTGIEITGTAKDPVIGVKANTYDAYGAAEEVKTGVENGTIKAKAAERADDATHADAAAKVDTAITVKVGGADIVFDGSAAKTADVDAAIAAGVAEAKRYADDNDANTEYHVEYDSTNKKIKLVAGADASKMEIDATDFIKDGMIDTVTIGDDNDLVITFNTAAGKDEIRLPLDQLVDIYTGDTTDTITVRVSADKVITAEVKTNSIKDGHIASDAAIAKGKLATDVQTSLGKADTAIQAADLGALAAKSIVKTADIDDKAVTEAKLADAVTTKLNKVWEEVGVAQGLINDLDYTATGMGKGKTIATLTETDGKIAATFQDIEITHGQVSDFESAVKDIVITNPALHSDEVTIGDLYEHLDDRFNDKVDNTASINGKSFNESVHIKIYGDDIAIYNDDALNRPSVSAVLAEIANTTINGNHILDSLWEMEEGSEISQNIVLTGTDIKMSDSDATTLNAAITARQTEAQVNALIKAMLNSITEINCGTSTTVI